jgi:hypothetical protein
VVHINNGVLLSHKEYMGFEGKWMQLEDIMLNEVNRDKKHKKAHVFSQTWKINPKINIYTKTSIIYKLSCRIHL